MADGVQHRQPVVAHQLVDPREELSIVADADMLEHADGNDPVEAADHLAVVAKFEVDPAGEPGPPGAFAR